MANIPKDPAMLLSYVNTQLRDFYPNPDEMCRALSVSREEVEKKLREIDYTYDPKTNQYV